MDPISQQDGRYVIHDIHWTYSTLNRANYVLANLPGVHQTM